ncbi:isoprenyl transferase [uncultured Desulfobacter sp.]|uniref:isoprenyl transferase n=1 Tax=uncultured Desulfobacter sp. TaxID=240139 RepID=UPI0029F59ECC|nr:isoprenyl transferase [uncultured Desulfobacter sp.]
MKSDSTIQVPDGLDLNSIPAHVACIMDGNGRWAKKRLMNRVKGHEQGAQTVEEIVMAAREIGIKVLTLYAFSTENWARPKEEVKALMHLLKRFLKNKTEKLRQKDIRLNLIGQTYRLPDDVREQADLAMAATADNSAMILNLAISYGAREEITMAVQQIAAKVKSGSLDPEEITDKTISGHLYTAGMPDPDLIIRTSAEFRLSNFLMWQAAYSEFAFIPTLWPDFTRQEFYQVLIDYQQRDRRFGKV